MADKVSSETRRKIMQSVKSKNTKLENAIIKELWRRGLRFRRNVKELPGKPDIAIKKYKVVIFIDSCYWHGCDLHCRLPQTNRDYWVNKIEANKARDASITGYYNSNGWNILRIWEHRLKDDFIDTIEEVLEFINKAKKIGGL